MEHKNTHAQRPGLMQEIGNVREEITEIHNVEIDKNLSFIKHSYYEGSTSIKLLAHKVRKQQS